jgi:antitoxin (DNA-binding transcriptional repressor) of toxin-antitoxin stability system
MDFYSVKYWEENFDSLLERVENGETIGIENTETGERAVMVPADDELIRMYYEENNEAQ